MNNERTMNIAKRKADKQDEKKIEMRFDKFIKRVVFVCYVYYLVFLVACSMRTIFMCGLRWCGRCMPGVRCNKQALDVVHTTHTLSAERDLTSLLFSSNFFARSFGLCVWLCIHQQCCCSCCFC